MRPIHNKVVLGSSYAMNDPHVESLHYKVMHEDSVNYDRAELLEFETAEFRLQVEEGNVTVWPNAHFPEKDEARAIIEPFIRRWEFDAAVERGAKEFRLKFDYADVIDRNPTPGVVTANARPVNWNVSVSTPTVVVGRGHYPTPPSGSLMDPANPDAQSMLQRLEGYRQGKEPLGDMAYFCVTVIERAGSNSLGSSGSLDNGSRAEATKYFHISKSLLNEVARLSTDKGGSLARKAKGTAEEYSLEEETFLINAIQAFILRAAEKAANPTADLPKITKSHLPYRP